MDIKQKVLQWAWDRGILDGATPCTVMLKTTEEVGELARAIGKCDLPQIEDTIGNIAVSLIIQAHMQGLDFDICLESAYYEIAKRKGKMVNGLFVKEKGV